MAARLKNRISSQGASIMAAAVITAAEPIVSPIPGPVVPVKENDLLEESMLIETQTQAN
jgi:hypothetical protein